MTTERLVAIAALVFSVLTAVVAGTWIAGTTLATQDQVDRAVSAGIAPLATTADVAREVGSIKAELAALPSRDDVAEIVANAVRTALAEATTPLATKEDLSALEATVETFDAKADALIDCIIDLDGPRVFLEAQALTAADPDAPPTAMLNQSPSRLLPNSCDRARQLVREP